MKLGPLEIKRNKKLTEGKPQIVELGATGTIILSGQLTETEYNSDLKFPDSIKVYDRMRRSDGQVKGTLLACGLPIRAAHWDIKAASPDPTDTEIAKVVGDNLFDQMTITWDSFLRQILTMLPFGFSLFEKVWELKDGLYQYRKFAPRLQKTIFEWNPDAEGGLSSVTQQVFKGNVYQFIPIPIEKLLLFNIDQEGSDFVGISLLRAAYKHWYYKDVLYKIDGIAAERHGVGVAVFTMPSTATTEGTGSDKEKIEKMGESLHTHERSYIALPEGFGFDLKGVTGQLHDTIKSAEHHDMQIARSILLQFMNLGANAVGSYAQSVDQSGFFLMALKAIGDSICDTVNRYAIPQMVDYNWDVKRYPKLTMSGLEKWEILSYASAVAQLVNVGALDTDEGIEDELRRLLKFPPKKVTPVAEKTETTTKPVIGETATKQITSAKPGKEGDAAENIAEGAKLNGIQIQASMEVLWSYINGNVPETVAIELLVAVGIDRDRATSMVKACKGFKPENPALLTPGKTEKQFKERILSVILAEPQPLRQPKGAEIFLAVEDIEKKLDSSQHELISAATEVQRRQIQQIAESAMRDIRDGRLSKFLETKIPWRDQMEATVYRTLLDLFDFGKEQVANELKRQRGTRKMAESVEKPTPTEMLKARAKAVTETLATKLHAAMTWEALRQSKSGEIDQVIFASTLMNLSARDLEMVAAFSVNEAFNLGREDEAKANGDIERVVYSALMDQGTCDACAGKDGTEYPFPSAEWDEVVPPYTECEGRDKCRCVGIFILKSENR